MKEKDIANFISKISNSFSTLTSCVTYKWNTGNKNHYSFFMLKIDDVLINQVLFSFEMIKYTSFAEINMNLWLLQKHS